jgi:hypothetical protein
VTGKKLKGNHFGFKDREALEKSLFGCIETSFVENEALFKLLLAS